MSKYTVVDCSGARYTIEVDEHTAAMLVRNGTIVECTKEENNEKH